MNRHGAPLLTFLLLCACGESEQDANLGGLEAKVAHNDVDSALREAIEAPIATDPDLRREGNRDALRPADKPMDGALPFGLSSRSAQERALKLAGGKLLPTPAPTKIITSTKSAISLSGIAQEQGLTQGCGMRLGYGMEWAQRLPATLPLYPGAELKDAAGLDDPRCTISAVTFATNAPARDVLDFYYTMALRAGYAVEHVEQDGGHAFNGRRSKNGAAFTLKLRSAPDGGIEGDLIFSQRR